MYALLFLKICLPIDNLNLLFRELLATNVINGSEIRKASNETEGTYPPVPQAHKKNDSTVTIVKSNYWKKILLMGAQ